MRFRKPELFPLLFILCAVALFVTLGVWQVERLEWKNGIVAAIEQAQALPQLTSLPQSTDGLDYRNVELTGEFLNDKTMRTIGAPPGLPGDHSQGFHLVVPFKLAHDKRIILVDRGWAPEHTQNDAIGEQTIRGIIRPPHPKPMFAFENRPDKNIWFYDDIEAMSAASGVTLTPVIVSAVGKQQAGVYPTPGDGKIVLRNDHLQYAITWFSLALIGVVMFGFYHRVPEQKA